MRTTSALWRAEPAGWRRIACWLQTGRIVEQGDCAEVLVRPAHGYTRQLLAAVPRLAAV